MVPYLTTRSQKRSMTQHNTTQHSTTQHNAQQNSERVPPTNWRRVNNLGIKVPPSVWIGWVWRNKVKSDFPLPTSRANRPRTVSRRHHGGRKTLTDEQEVVERRRRQSSKESFKTRRPKVGASNQRKVVGSKAIPSQLLP